MKKKLLLFIFMMPSLGVTAAEDYLFHQKKSDYHIVVSASASESEKTAAQELQLYLHDIGGVTIPVTMDLKTPGTNIYIGYNQLVGERLSVSRPDLDDESFSWITRKGSLYIYGGGMRGSMYGVYRFLETQFGVRWFFYDCTRVPHLDFWKLPEFDHHESPAFKYRHVFYYSSRAHVDWDAHNALNSIFGRVVYNRWGGLESLWGGHSMGEMVSAADYFKVHPEYFCLRNGKRFSDGQLCLSNPHVLNILKKKTLQMIATEPGHWCYEVSQNDNEYYCECKNCSAIEKKYGGHSGLILWAINQIAQEVRKKYPAVMISTLAYHYTQGAPKGIRPGSNVLIRLCDIECCLAHPITNGEKNNEIFLSDLKAWCKLTKNITVWDYMTGFYQYLAPFPNFQAMAQNIRLYRDHRLLGVKAEGTYQYYGGEFYELKQWLLAKLLWNPDEDSELLTKEFMEGYYGAAANEIYAYYQLCCSLVNDGSHFGFDVRETHPMFTDEFLSKGQLLLKNAAKKVKGDENLTRRVERLLLQIVYLKYKKCRGKEYTKSREELIRLLENQPTYINENLKSEDFLKELRK